MVETWNDVFGEGDEENKQRGNTAFACFCSHKRGFLHLWYFLENKGRVNHFHARWCATVAWFTGGEVKNDAHSELECIELQAR